MLTRRPLQTTNELVESVLDNNRNEQLLTSLDPLSRKTLVKSQLMKHALKKG